MLYQIEINYVIFTLSSCNNSSFIRIKSKQLNNSFKYKNEKKKNDTSLTHFSTVEWVILTHILTPPVHHWLIMMYDYDIQYIYSWFNKSIHACLTSKRVKWKLWDKIRISFLRICFFSMLLILIDSSMITGVEYQMVDKSNVVHLD